jgi:enoyl-CoA hydratase/3-hydroxyacyl-CoA dehydrogenase
MATPLPRSLIKLDVSGSVATIAINRPEARNSLNPAVVHQLQQAFDQAAIDPTVRGIVLAGEGKAFVVGADVDFFMRNIEAGDIERIIKFTQAGHRLLSAIDACPKRVVARVHGVALGAGVEIALACDYLVAARGASFGFPETGLGIYPGLGGTQRASRALGVGIAKWLIFAGKTISATDAWRIGLAHQILPAEKMNEFCAGLAAGQLTCEPAGLKSPELSALEQFFARFRVDDLLTSRAETGGDPALERAMKQLAGKSPLALRLAERLIDDGIGGTLEQGLQGEIDHLAEIFATPDAYQRLRSRSQQRLG